MLKIRLPDSPGVYFFIGSKGKILYIGKATSLKSRVKSYFSEDMETKRSLAISNMIRLAKTVHFLKTESVLEALILESALIKKHKPEYNTDEKDNKSFNHIVITKEDFPRVLVARQRDIDKPEAERKSKIDAVFGPFPKGGELREAIKIVRKIFPFRDKCTPPLFLEVQPPKKGKRCFNRQIGLCPGVCSGEIGKKDYDKQIRNLKLFLAGKKAKLVKDLEKEMKKEARKHNFEKAGELKKKIFSLKHIQDISLLKREAILKNLGENFRVEAYDVAHLGGKDSVAVMTVVENGEANKSEYRKFRLRFSRPADDLSALEEVLRRRFNHPEWRIPNLIVVDGGINQKKKAEKVLTEAGESIPVISVVKDEKHRPKGILGGEKLKYSHDREILLANNEAHRFAILYHRELRDRNFSKRKTA